jgi:hypothetical protein
VTKLAEPGSVLGLQLKDVVVCWMFCSAPPPLGVKRRVVVMVSAQFPTMLKGYWVEEPVA